jgi:hypothetical protein
MASRQEWANARAATKAAEVPWATATESDDDAWDAAHARERELKRRDKNALLEEAKRAGFSGYLGRFSLTLDAAPYILEVLVRPDGQELVEGWFVHIGGKEERAVKRYDLWTEEQHAFLQWSDNWHEEFRKFWEGSSPQFQTIEDVIAFMKEKAQSDAGEVPVVLVPEVD